MGTSSDDTKDRGETSPPAPMDATLDPRATRRRTLGMLVATGSALYAGALAVPAARFLAVPAGSATEGRWIRVARLDALKDGEPTRVQVVGDQKDAFTVTPAVTLGSVWIARSGASVSALSAECPHLGCAIDLAANKTNFGCPCHTSRFALDGRAESGPSPRGMDALDARVVEGWVEIDFRRFRQGATERTEVKS